MNLAGSPERFDGERDHNSFIAPLDARGFNAALRCLTARQASSITITSSQRAGTNVVIQRAVQALSEGRADNSSPQAEARRWTRSRPSLDQDRRLRFVQTRRQDDREVDRWP